MKQDNSSTTDKMEITKTDSGGMDLVSKKTYEVINDLFKNGKTIPKGEKIDMDDKTAKNFIASGDIKEVQS